MAARTTILPTLGLLAMTAVWGSTFFMIKDVVARMPVADFLAVRFAVAALAMLALFPRNVWRLGRAGLARGLALGAIYGAGQLLQTRGLQLIAPAFAGMMTADEARRFVAGKVFTFTCFDGTRGAGRILDDMGAAGAVQFAGSGPIRHIRLPGNTLQIRGQSVCASLRGLPFEPCFNLDKTSEVSFRGSVSGMGFAYCDFHHQGATSMMMARAPETA